LLSRERLIVRRFQTVWVHRDCAMVAQSRCFLAYSPRKEKGFFSIFASADDRSV
jgi:hypothetical protein